MFSDMLLFEKWFKKLLKFTINLKIKNDYVFKKTIGTGASAKVYLIEERKKILPK